MTMSSVLTTQTRVDIKHGGGKDLFEYLTEYKAFYAAIQRRVWHDIKNGSLAARNKSAYTSELSRKHNILIRTARAIVADMQGRYKALVELRKTELKQATRKLRAVEKRLSKRQKDLAKLKPKVAENRACEDELIKYRNLKTSIYWLHVKIQRLKARIEKLRNGKPNMCFGTRALWNKQYRLKESGFSSHKKWLEAFREKRDAEIYYLGSKDETCSNGLFQLSPSYDDLGRLIGFRLTVRKDIPFRKDGEDLDIVCDEVKFKYLGKEIAACVDKRLDDGKRASLSDIIGGITSVSYRVKAYSDRLYIFASFKIENRRITDSFEGTIGIDFNNAFLEAVEIDRQGNIVNIEKFGLRYHGSGSKAKSEMQETVNKIMYRCRVTGKDLVIEKLDFSDKKSATISKKGVVYNGMLHRLDYARFRDICVSTGTRLGVAVTMVSPANTSRIGRQKYAVQRKLTEHQAAAYVIARRGKGFKDILKKAA